MLYTGNVEYHCCNKEKRGNEIWVWCGHPAKGSNWFIAFKLILLVVYFLACLFWPVRLLIVPADYLFTSVENNENEIPKAELLSDEIPVDDLSPITCSTLLKKCVTHFTTTGNFFKLFCFYYIFIPFSVYIYLALHYTLLLDFLSEIEAKNAFEDGAIFNYVFDIRNKLYCLLLALVLFVILPGMVLFSIESKPHYVNKLQNAVRKNLKLLPKSISPHHECFKYSLKTAISEIIPGPYKITKTSLNYTSKVWKMLFYLNYVFAIDIYVTLFLLYAAICGILGTVLLTYFLLRSVINIMMYSPSATLLAFLANEFVKSFSDGKKSPETVLRNPKKNGFLLSFSYLLSFLWVSYFALLAFLCCNFFTKMFGFVIMGLIINAQRTTPYVIFTYVLINNISISFNNFQNRFKQVKEIISKHWKEKASSLQSAEISGNTIPRNLFWFVCDERNVLPYRKLVLW